MYGRGPMMGGHRGPMGGPMHHRPMGFGPGMGYRPMGMWRRPYHRPLGFFPLGGLFILPALISWGVCQIMRSMELIREGDLKLSE